MTGSAGCPTTTIWEQFLRGQLDERAHQRLAEHLTSCTACLHHVAETKSDDPLIQVLQRQAASAAGAEKAAAISWLLERVKASASMPKVPQATGAAPPATVVGGKPRADTPKTPLDHTAGAGKPAVAQIPANDLYGFLAPPQSPDELGRLGGYRVLDILGSGGMGVVFRAEDVQLKRYVALKAILPAMANDQEIRQRFIREAQATAAIDNDHVIPIFQVSEDRGVPYLAMPLLRGETLEQWLKRAAQATVGEILRLAREIASGLAAAHVKGLIHRDIKPANIWLEAHPAAGAAGRVKILDFGLARPVNDDVQLTQSGFIAGTPAYMAPEQARGGKIDHRCDLFSLGSVLYRVCTGELPFKGDTTMAILTALAVDIPRPVIELAPQFPLAFSQLIMQMLAKHPNDRPSSAQNVVERIQTIERTLGVQQSAAAVSTRGISQVPSHSQAVTPAFPEARGKFPSRRLWLIGASVAALALLALATIGWKPATQRKEADPAKPPPNDPVAVVDDGKPVTNSIGMKLVYIPAGTFLMGSPDTDIDRESMEGPQHKVRISKPFYLGVYEVKQSEYLEVMGRNPSFFKDSLDQPVERVGWDEALEFCRKLSERPDERKAGRRYRLPTEAEWEYACRAGAATIFSHGDSLSSTQANFNGNFPYGGAAKGPQIGAPAPVGRYPANAFGLHDMYGNVWEWCLDGFRAYPNQPTNAVADPSGALPQNDKRMMRGGSWRSEGFYCRSARRYNLSGIPRDDVGFRVVLEIGRAQPIPIPVTSKPAATPVKTGHLANSIGMKLAYIPSGEFSMGSPPDEVDRQVQFESVQHRVRISASFYLGVYEVKQSEYQTVMGDNPSKFKDRPNHPVEMVSWPRADEFCKKLSELPEEKKAGRRYRLPTEAEWEYACRAGSTTVFSHGNTLSSDQANFNGTEPYGGAANGLRRGETLPCGTFPANAFGLHDMHGNVWEWCLDDRRDYPKTPPKDVLVDPRGSEMSTVRMHRGGGFQLGGHYCRSARRFSHPASYASDDLGFRVLLEVPASKPAPMPPKAGSKDGSVKVFILAGQSDMGGKAKISTLDWLGADPKHADLLRRIRNSNGSWVVRDDVWVYQRAQLPERVLREKRGPLSVGYGEDNDQEIGPELLFGHVMGDCYENQVLLIKITQGPTSLAAEARPPSSGGKTGPFYTSMLATVRDVLANLKNHFPAYQGQGYEIAGLVWFQGWNDMTSREVNEATRYSDYEKNLANFIRDVRKDLALPKLPVIIGELGVDGAAAQGGIMRMRQAQAAVAALPEFQGNVILVKTSECWDAEAHALLNKGYDMVKNKWTDEKAKEQFDKMGSTLAFLYMGSGKVNALIGAAFGEAMRKLCAP